MYARLSVSLIEGFRIAFMETVMTASNGKYENELVVTSVASKDDSVTLSLRFPKPRLDEQPKLKMENIAEPLAKTQMEKAGMDVAKGYMAVVQKQIQQQAQQLGQIFPRPPPSDIIAITISKQEYENLGRPTVHDAIALTLKKKTKN